MRSETFDLLDSSDRKNSSQHIDDVDDVVSSPTDGQTALSAGCTAAADLLDSSLDHMDETSATSHGRAGFKALGFLRRFTKDRPKDDRSTESSKSEVKKRGFSLWGRKSKKKSGDGGDGSEGGVGGVVKSATLPGCDVSRDSARLIPGSATTEALVSPARADVVHTSRVSDLGTTHDAGGGGGVAAGEIGCTRAAGGAALVQHAAAAGVCESRHQSVDLSCDAESDPPQRRTNCTSIVTTV